MASQDTDRIQQQLVQVAKVAAGVKPGACGRVGLGSSAVWVQNRAPVFARALVCVDQI